MMLIWLIILGAGIAQLPLLADLLQQVFPEAGITRLVHRGFKPILVGTTLLLSGAALWLFFDTFLTPAVIGLAEDPASHQWTFGERIWAALLTIVAVWLWVNVVGNYLLAVMLDPAAGSRHRWNNRRLRSLEDGFDGTVEGTKAPATGRWCRHCNATKAELVTHCKICRRCLITDHHCPFTGNCVGVGNIANFWLWLAYLSTGMGFAMILSWPSFQHCVTGPLFNPEGYPEPAEGVFDHCEWAGGMSLIVVPLAMVWFGVLCILVFETWLMIQQRTTIDVCLKLQNNPLTMFGPAPASAPWKSFRAVLGLPSRSSSQDLWRLMLRCSLPQPHSRPVRKDLSGFAL